MLGLLPTNAHPPSAAPPAAHGLPADPELLARTLSGRLSLTPQLSDAVLQLAATQHGRGGSPSPADGLRRGSSDSGCVLGAGRADKPLAPLPRRGVSDSSADESSSHCQDAAGEQTVTSEGSPLSPAASGAAAAGSAALGAAIAAQAAAAPAQQSPLTPATPVTPASSAATPSPVSAAAASPSAGHASARVGSPRAEQIALLQAQLCAVNERAASLEFHLRAKASEVSTLETYRRRAQELEALYTLSASELARAQEQAFATQHAAISQLKAQQLRILLLEEHLRATAAAAASAPGAAADGDLQAALLQQQLGRSGAGAGLGAVPSAFESAASLGLAGMPLPPGMQVQLGGHGLGGLGERQASLPNPASSAALSDFARDSEVWSLRGHAPSAAAGRPVRAQSLVLPPACAGADGGTWSVSASAAGMGFAAAASAAPLALPPLPTASSASAWDAGALLMASRQSSLLDAAAAASVAAGHGPRESGDLISDRADAQRLAGLLPFDLDTLGSERSDPGLPAFGHAMPPLPPTASLPPLSRAPSAGGSAGGARSAALKAAAAQKQAAAAAAAHLQALAGSAGGAGGAAAIVTDPRLRRWSEAWGGVDGDACVTADQNNPFAAALKRFGSAPSAALAAAAAAGGAAAALYGIPVAQRGGRASSAAGEDRDAELDAAAQNARLRSKRDATPNTCVYVGFLGWWVTEKELEACFAPHGKLVSVRLLISKKSRRSREQAFVEFDAIDAARAAIAAMDGLDSPALVKQPGCGGLVVRFADRKKEEDGACA
ncbi:hypothetical protein Rsub_09302 [Raphidocelis subcapitata]|uniref:RRM domain-containing protein n=1 Tax=Raphidocelis subcapitata TaxID=307507 RepID=A0A2V0PAX1_9CHLO|nr:hypothetical protein Rsub_09302 [Raphidocelis subcapitata]|eukprot:GBF96669.1 hypothetical protein Rsub_09302 [Raphidocelis subcapitata]